MVEEKSFGQYNGRNVRLFVLKNECLEVELTDFGALIRCIKVTTRQGKKDVVLGFNSIDEYVKNKIYAGANIGRVANRISKARFVLNGKTYHLDNNERDYCNHSGFNGYESRFFDVSEVNGEKDSVKFSLISDDGDQGFPGRLKLFIEYKLKGGCLNIEYSATTDKDTYFAPTNHTYFNLNGEGSGDIFDTKLKIYGDRITEISDDLIPTGRILSVKGTPFDFTEEKAIGQDIYVGEANSKRDGDSPAFHGIYDHNYVLDGGGKAATAYSEKTGIRLEVFSDLPGVQLYSGYLIGDVVGKSRYTNNCGFCLEMQYFPDAVNRDEFIKPIVHAGETVKHFIMFKISADK